MPGVERFTARHGYEVAGTYTVSEGAWNGGKDGGEYKRTLQHALGDAHAGKFKVLIVWALDRITREGAEVLRGAENADEGGVHDAHEESGDSGSVVGEVPGGIGKVP